MVNFPSLVLLTALSASVSALPLQKRIQQTISDSTQKWEDACNAAGGGLQCNPIAVSSFMTLLAAAGPCDQQNAADQMIDFAKTLKNNADMIKFAQIFAQQPRNSPTSLSVPYCGSAPKNPELNGLFQCQFQSTNPTTFVGSSGNLKVGDAGTIPFGHSGKVSPPGSCPANPSGPIPDGQQLVDITQNPGVGASSGTSTGSGSASSASAVPSAATSPKPVDVSAPSASAVVSSAAPAATSAAVDNGDNGCDDGGDETASVAPATPTAVNNSGSVPPASATATTSGSNSSDFHLKNGQDAQKLNAQSETMTLSDSCTEGSEACVPDGKGNTVFGQCVGGKWQPTTCAATLQCFALPLVNKAGTSLTCTTQSDAAARIAATGATGGIDGKSN